MLGGAVLFAAVLTFNNWLLALIINRNLLIHGGSISELNVYSQPYHYIFESLDIASGILFALFGLLVIKAAQRKTYAEKVLVYGTIIFGLANALDAFFVLPCSETLDKNCTIPITINWSHFNFPSHGYSSVLIAVCYFVLPLAGWFYSKQIKNKRFKLLSLAALLVALVSFVSALWQYFQLHALSVKASGWAQGVQMLVLAGWFWAWFEAIDFSFLPKNND